MQIAEREREVRVFHRCRREHEIGLQAIDLDVGICQEVRAGSRIKGLRQQVVVDVIEDFVVKHEMPVKKAVFCTNRERQQLRLFGYGVGEHVKRSGLESRLCGRIKQCIV